MFLLCVGFIPFPTALLAEHLGDPGARVATLVYGGWFTVTAVVYNLLWWYPTHGRRLVAAGVAQPVLHRITRRFRLGPPIYLLATLLAVVSPSLSVTVHLVLAVVYFLPYGGRGAGQTR